jgi:hypothetical protein
MAAAVVTDDKNLNLHHRLSDYFINRALELLEDAKAEADPIRKLDIEARVARYWEISRTAARY